MPKETALSFILHKTWHFIPSQRLGNFLCNYVDIFCKLSKIKFNKIQNIFFLAILNFWKSLKYEWVMVINIMKMMYYYS